MLFVHVHAVGASDPTKVRVLLPPVRLVPSFYTKKVEVGGCDEAKIKAYGTPAALDALRGYLGYGVQIVNEHGTPCWWGFIDKANVSSDEGLAELECKGWGHKFKSYFYANSIGMASTMDGKGDKHNVSEGSGITKLAQSFSNSGTAWTVRAIGLNLYVSGTRSDSVNVTVMNNSSGDPGATTISAWATSPTGAQVAAANGYMQYDLTTPFTHDSTVRWLVITPTGTLPIASGMYQVGVNDAAAYSGGSFKYYIPSTWTANRADTGKDTDIQFKLLGSEPTDDLISALYTATVAGDNFAGISFDNLLTYPSTCQYRDGKERADKVLEALLKVGDTSSQRLIYEIDAMRRMRVFAQPTLTYPNLIRGAVKIGQDMGTIYNKVRAIYTTQSGASSAGNPVTTAWSENSTSQTRYGIRELTLTLDNVDATAAANAVSTAVYEKAFPATTFDFLNSGSIDVYGYGGGKIRRDTCPYGYWGRLTNASVSASDSPFTRGASVCFIDGGEYDAENDEYTPLPKGQIDPLKRLGVEYRET